MEIDQADLNEAMQVLLRRRKQQLDDEMEVLAEPHGYPMIAIAPKQVEGGHQEQKKKLVQRLFKRNGTKVQVTPKCPTTAARNTFVSAYTMDKDGDAIIRVHLEV